MAEDKEMLAEIWGGKLPICFTLASEELSITNTPDPVYLMVPRVSYFPIVTEKVRRHFSLFVTSDKSKNEMWLTFEGQPLKWHYPIGLLYDMYVTDATLPWQITVHFDKYPENDLMRCPNKDFVESHLMQCLKEADTLKHKNRRMESMQKRDHKQLWSGLLDDRFDQYWSANRKLMEHSNGEGYRYIPFRLYATELKNKPYIQFLITPEENERKLTLQDLISKASAFLSNEGPFQVIIHGVDIPLNTPLQWMSEHLSYPDNFLHLFLRPAASP